MNEYLAELDADELADLVEVGATTDPKDYYFKVTACSDQFSPLFVVINPRKYVDDNGYQYDGEIAGLLELEPDYDALDETSFEAGDPNATKASIEADLLSRGFVQNDAL